MKFKEIIDKCYKPKKDGSIGFYGMKFAEKCGFGVDCELTEYEALSTLLNLSKEKQVAVFGLIKSKFESDKRSEPTIGDTRILTYKQFAKLVHPDSIGGSDSSFKALQELKEFLWDYNGQPRKKISLWQWSHEREFNEGGGIKYGFSYERND
ncbi:MAG: hypothetical protein ACRCZ0_08200 [Cetobacterium sp.]